MKKILMPEALTAENGAKGLMMSEFKERLRLQCVCDSDLDDCELCNGTGEIEQEVLVSWTTIKEIYAMAVKHLGEPEPFGILYVLSGTEEQANDFAVRVGLHPTRYRYITHPYDLRHRGRGLRYVKVGTWLERRDIEEILMTLEVRDAIEVKGLED